MLNTRRDVAQELRDLPLVLLDATLPAELVRSYLPRLEVADPVRVQAPHMQVHQVTGGFGKTSLAPHGDPATAENRRRRRRIGELRDFVAGVTRGARSLLVTYEALEPFFDGVPGLETAHFNDVAGKDGWRDVRHLVVLGRPLPKPEDVRQLAAAMTGRPADVGTSRRESRGLRMADGTGAAIEVRTFADPAAEAVRAAITDAEVVQAAGRARGVNRGPDDPVTVWLLADVATPLVVHRLHVWRDLAPGPVERVACRGVLFASPAAAAAACPDVFETPKAAERAFHRARALGPISPPVPL